jgi:hypothetical protein
VPHFETRDDYERWKAQRANEPAKDPLPSDPGPPPTPRSRGVGWGLVAGGSAFLLEALQLTLDADQSGYPSSPNLALLSGGVGATLGASGLSRLGFTTSGGLAAIGLLLFALPWVLRSLYAVIGLKFDWAGISIAALVILVSIQVVRRPLLQDLREPGSTSEVGPVGAAGAVGAGRGLETAASVVGLLALSVVAWFQAPFFIAAALSHVAPVMGIRFPRSEGPAFALLFIALGAAPVGLIAGAAPAVWISAAPPGRERARRFVLAALLVVAVPLLVMSVPVWIWLVTHG